jgi:hypothetical protein
MDFFQKLGRSLDDRWRAKHYDEDAFPELAAAALKEFSPAENVATYAPLVELLTGRDSAPQIGRGDFGQPPVQVFVSRRFYIEALYWLDSTTAIHEHGFNGAFHVMSGSSIHCLYRFDAERRYNSGALTGRLTREFVELLKKGDTRPILAGKAMAHSLFHLDRPSVTIVVRTSHTPGADPQYSYTFPGLAEDPFYSPELTARLLQAVDALVELQHPELDQILGRTFQNVEPQVLINMAHAMRGRGIFKSIEHLRSVMELARDPHGGLVDALAESVIEMFRQDAIRSLRAKLHNPEQRFFLALLLHFQTGAEVLDFVAKRYPGRDPRDLVLEWLNEWTQTADPKDASKKVLDMVFDGSMMEVMKLMLAGRPLDEVMVKLGEEFEGLAEEEANLKRMHKSLSSHRVFGSLFR